MKLLAIDTSGSNLGVTLAEDGRILTELNQCAGRSHSRLLVKTVDSLLSGLGWKISDLNKICVTTGPGSFTGIRIGVSYARAVGQWLKIPVVGIPTLDVLAAGVPADDYAVAPIVDALGGFVFSAVYDGKTGKRISDYTVVRIDEALEKIKRKKRRCVFLGDALLNDVIYKKIEKLPCAVAPEHYRRNGFPRTSVLALAGFGKKGSNYSAVLPFYLKPSFAESSLLR